MKSRCPVRGSASTTSLVRRGVVAASACPSAIHTSDAPLIAAETASKPADPLKLRQLNLRFLWSPVELLPSPANPATYATRAWAAPRVDALRRHSCAEPSFELTRRLLWLWTTGLAQ
jgi:hypothetical protein